MPAVRPEAVTSGVATSDPEAIEPRISPMAPKLATNWIFDENESLVIIF